MLPVANPTVGFNHGQGFNDKRRYADVAETTMKVAALRTIVEPAYDDPDCFAYAGYICPVISDEYISFVN